MSKILIVLTVLCYEIGFTHVNTLTRVHCTEAIKADAMHPLRQHPNYPWKGASNYYYDDKLETACYTDGHWNYVYQKCTQYTYDQMCVLETGCDEGKVVIKKEKRETHGYTGWCPFHVGGCWNSNTIHAQCGKDIPLYNFLFHNRGLFKEYYSQIGSDIASTPLFPFKYQTITRDPYRCKCEFWDPDYGWIKQCAWDHSRCPSNFGSFLLG